MLKRILTLATVAVLSVSALPPAAQAQQAAEPASIGVFGKWEAWQLDEPSGKVCYMLARPDKDSGAYKTRGNIYVLITHRPAEGTKNVFSYIAGYEYKAKSAANIKIGDKKFSLFTQGETAWAADADTDNALAEAIRKGSTMVVTGTSSRGTVTTDTFSLKGSGGAHDAIGKACGI